MSQVTCPRCRTVQPAEGDGYVCVTCGATWTFARCERCASAFHLADGTTRWTCPSCGTAHGTEREREHRTRSRSTLVIAGGVALAVVIGIVIAVVNASGGDGGVDPSAAEQARATTCTHVAEGFEVIREEALARTADTLAQDAAALRAAGDEPTAARIDGIVTITRELSAAIATQQDQTALTGALLDALESLPC